MSQLGGSNCPFCRFYNGRGERRCGRCDKLLPPEPIASLIRTLQLSELWATKLLFGVNAFVFMLQLMDALKERGGFVMSFPISNLLRFGALSSISASDETGFHAVATQPYRLLAGCFVHMGLLHIGMNMLALADLGRLGEPLVKGARFIVTYVVTGIVGFLVSSLWYGTAPYITAGASGAIFGLDGLFLAYLAINRDRRWKEMLVRTIVSSFAFYFLLHTNQAAHLGGLVAGFLMGLAFGKEKQPYKRDSIFYGLAALGLVATVVCLVLPQRDAIWRIMRDQEHAEELRGHFNSE